MQIILYQIIPWGLELVKTFINKEHRCDRRLRIWKIIIKTICRTSLPPQKSPSAMMLLRLKLMHHVKYKGHYIPYNNDFELCCT